MNSVYLIFNIVLVLLLSYETEQNYYRVPSLRFLGTPSRDQFVTVGGIPQIPFAPQYPQTSQVLSPQLSQSWRYPQASRVPLPSRVPKLSKVLLARRLQQPTQVSQVIQPVQIKQVYDECGSHDEEDATVAQSFKKLMLLGDRELLLSSDAGHQDDHCNDAQKHLKNFVDHVKCTEGKFKEEMTLLSNGFKQWVNNRCFSKKWHDQFIKVSQCFAVPQVQEEWHTCHDRDTASHDWIVKNVPPQYQVDAMCCFIPLTKRCQHNKTDIYCGRQLADLSSDLMWQPWNERIDTWCHGKLDCQNYPRILNAMNKIWNSDAPVENTGKFYKLFFKVLKNTFTHQEFYNPKPMKDGTKI